jgi:post-segregation antitoxin (ccd killing protein)
MSDAMAHVTITTTTANGPFTEHWTTTYVEARGIVARHVHLNGLFRNAYSDAEWLFRDGAVVGHYSIARFYRP